MFTLIADRLNRLTRRLPLALPDERADETEPGQSGWHESSWVLAQGVEVIELPAALSASYFPDTQPAFYDNAGDSARLAA
jgi:hypothetical protein